MKASTPAERLNIALRFGNAGIASKSGRMKARYSTSAGSPLSGQMRTSRSGNCAAKVSRHICALPSAVEIVGRDERSAIRQPRILETVFFLFRKETSSSEFLSLNNNAAPPLTWIVWPVMKPPSSPTRNRQVAAISSTCPWPPERDAGGVRLVVAVPFGVVAPRVDAAGRDDVDPDVVRRKLGGEPARHPDQRHLRRRQVGAAAAAGGNRAVAAEEQHAAVLVLDHFAEQGARQVEGAVEHHVADPFPVFVGHLKKRLVRPDRGVVDQDVDAAKLRQRLARQCLDFGLVADIGQDRDRLYPKVADLARDGLASCWLERALTMMCAPSRAIISAVARPYCGPSR